MALSVGRGPDHIRVLSELSGHVVGALLDEEDRTAPESDPFAAALRRYRNEGIPLDLTGSWRRTIAPAPLRASDSAADVLRLLARDLLACLAGQASAADQSGEPEVEAPPPNVRPIGAEIGSIPALELGSDGAWRPSTAPGVAADGHDGPQRRNAHVPSLGSRYPTVQAPGPHVFLPASPEAAAVRPPSKPERPLASTPRAPEDAPDPPASVPVAPPSVAPSATAAENESVIQSVSAGIEIVAGPFGRFQHLAAFVKSMRELGGVQSVTTRQFVRGMVHLRVRHSPGVDLAAALLTMTDFSPSIVSSTASRIELHVEPSDAIPPAES